MLLFFSRGAPLRLLLRKAAVKVRRRKDPVGNVRITIANLGFMRLFCAMFADQQVGVRSNFVMHVPHSAAIRNDKDDLSAHF